MGVYLCHLVYKQTVIKHNIWIKTQTVIIHYIWINLVYIYRVRRQKAEVVNRAGSNTSNILEVIKIRAAIFSLGGLVETIPKMSNTLIL